MPMASIINQVHILLIDIVSVYVSSIDACGCLFTDIRTLDSSLGR